ncbi:hypothetical protein [Actinoplanes palleronii]|uniref:hypothetical protein n=1 Tax=Actinoplanes palleronii TaxID=113570 RepID=UPI001944FA4F|nr:hypothetical protein [Actinoplanes palleronii]
MSQEPLIVVPQKAGIWSRLKDAQGAIVAEAWTYHRGAHQHVGRCHCRAPLVPGEPYVVGVRDAYPAACSAGHELVAYGPRPAKKTKNS